MNGLDLLMKGGWVMIPIGILSILGSYIFFNRLIALHGVTSLPRWVDQVFEKMELGDKDGVLAICSSKNAPFSRIINKSLTHANNDSINVENSVKLVAQKEVYNLENGLSILGTIVSVGPMLGFLGTVTGMIQSFMAISQSSGVSPKILSGGIYEAMVTTAAGLVVGILAKIAYNFLMWKLNLAVYNIEEVSNNLLNHIKKTKTSYEFKNQE
jgi:biopolymer transport protein ExbB